MDREGILVKFPQIRQHQPQIKRYFSEAVVNYSPFSPINSTLSFWDQDKLANTIQSLEWGAECIQRELMMVGHIKKGKEV